MTSPVSPMPIIAVPVSVEPINTPILYVTPEPEQILCTLSVQMPVIATAMQAYDTLNLSNENYGAIVDMTQTSYNINNPNNPTAAASSDVVWNNVIGTKFADNIKGANWAETISAGDGNDTIIGSGGADKLDGGKGIDTVDYSASVSYEGTPIFDIFGPMDHNPELGVNVNLETGKGEWGDANDDIYTSIENVVGSARDDVITGNDAANLLKGGAGYDSLSGGVGNDTLDGGTGNDQLNGGKGADKLIGGEGSDTAVYSDSSAAVNINLKTGFGSGGDAIGDRYTSIENVTGSNFNDTLTGDSKANQLDGGKGNDLFNGGLGADTFNGGEGVDTVTYANSGAGVQVTLEGFSYQGGAYPDEWIIADMKKAYVSGHGGDAEGDQLNGIEKIIGSNFNDVLTGDYNANTLEGGKGDDVLRGGGGSDLLSGGAGNDSFIVSFGSGNDVITDFQAGAKSGDKIIFEQVFNGSQPLMTFQDFMAHSTQVGKNLVFDFGNDHLTLNNVMKSQMTSDDFQVLVSMPIEDFYMPPQQLPVYEAPIMIA
jgi:Ca2+-binding RTX toxin-like protein